MEGEDFELLRAYVANQSEPAFRALVERHVNMVYATALRQVGDAHLAEEATQAVFITLAQKARGLSSGIILAGWLFRAAQFAAAKVQRAEVRRKHWEQQAAHMETNSSESAVAWEQMAPHLNDALNELDEPSRDALVLRFFESKSMAQVGSALGTSEGAAKMRVARALDQLRGIFQARGIALPVTLLATALSTSATQAAPLGLAATITTSALLKTSTPFITKGLFLFMSSTKKLAVAAIVVLSLSTATTSVLAFLLWKQQSPPSVAAAPMPPPPPGEQDVFLAMNDPVNLKMTQGKDGTTTVRTADGDFVVTNGVNHIVTTDAEGRTKEITIMTEGDEGGGRRTMTMRSSSRSAGGPPPGMPGGPGGGAVRVRSVGGPGAAAVGGFGTGAGAPGGGGFGGEVQIEERVTPPPAKQ